MNLESRQVTIEKSSQELFEKLCDVNSYEVLMQENISKFEVTGDDSFIFGLSGMPEIKLRMKEKIAPNKVILGAASDKLPFTLTANVAAVTENTSTVMLNFDGNFNAMMAMMIKGPITKFLDTLASNMHKL
jgi:hypothetical protein